MFELPELKYKYTDLEPYIDAQTMEIHYSKHHQGYVNNLNKALESHPELLDKSVEELLQELNSLPEDIQTAVRNNGGGHYNHSLFWNIMSPNPQTQPSDKLLEMINRDFGSIDKLKEEFNNAAAKRFGSGWAWLVQDGEKLEVISTPNQDSPVSQGKNALIGVDVWEHAYYLKYQNKRGDYVSAWWNVLDWEAVENNLN